MPPMDEKFIIETKNLSFIYENKLGDIKKSLNIENSELNAADVCKDQPDTYGEIKALNCIDLELKAGKFIGLLGRTGCGKSTLVRSFNGLIPHFYNGMFYGVVNILGKDTYYEEVSRKNAKRQI